MRTTTAWTAGREPRLSAHEDLAGSLRRGELAAALATVALIGQVLFAPVTLLIAALLVAVGRVSRWRPHWLLVPAVAALIWLLEAGGARVSAGFASSSRHLAGYLVALATHPARLAHPGAAFAGAAAWLPGQLPLALLIAAGEASIALWLGWWLGWRRAWDGVAAGQRFRPGLVALARRQVVAAALSAGHTVTADGCGLGLQISTGRLAGVSWAAAENGVLITGTSQADLELLGLAATCAALRLRKTVLLADLTGGGLAGQVTALARSLGVAAGEISSVAGGEPELRPGLGPASATVAGLAGIAGLAGRAGRAVRRRGVVVISAPSGDGPRQVIDDLASVLAGLRDLGLRADCLAWITGCEVVDAECLAALVRLGAETGTAVLLSTTSAAHAARLAAEVATIVAAGPIPGNLAMELASSGPRIGRQVASAAPLRAALAQSRPTLGAVPADNQVGDNAIPDILRTQLPGAFTILAGSQPGAGQSRVTAHCRAVPITLGDIR